MSIFDHLSFGVADVARTEAFYDAVLAPLGIVQLFRNYRAVCYGPAGFTGEAPLAFLQHGADARPNGPGCHLAFVATSRAAVDAFYAAAIAAGATDDGPPGIRYEDDPGYYAAFVRDLDGLRIEAVVHEKR